MISAATRIACAEYLEACAIHARALAKLDVLDRDSLVRCRLMTCRLTEAGQMLLDTLLASIRTESH